MLVGIYGILKNIFSSNNRDCGFQEGQLSYKKSSFNNGQIILINNNKKTVNLL